MAFAIQKGLRPTSKTLYDSTQSIFVRLKAQEEIKTLRVSVSENMSGATGILHNNVLNVSITDDNDDYFIYAVEIAEDDFKILKHQQGLQIDFVNFASELTKLLDLCKNPAEPRFILVIGSNEDNGTYNNHSSQNNKDIFLKVIETNHFKNICYLSLRIVPGSDADIKTHMSNKIKELTEQLDKQLKINSTQEMQIRDYSKKLDVKSGDYNELRLELNEEISKIKLETQKQLSEEREKLSRTQLDCQQKLEAEKLQIEEKHRSLINKLNEQINSLTFNNKNICETNCRMEESLEEKRREINRLETVVLQLKSGSDMWKKQLSSCDHVKHKDEKLINSLNTKLTAAEQEAKDKGLFINSLQQSLTEYKLKNTEVDSLLKQKELTNQKLEIELNSTKLENGKANEIIASFHAKLLDKNTKLKELSTIVVAQDDEVKRLASAETQKAEEITKLKTESDTIKTEFQECKTKLNELEKNLKEREEVLSKKEKTIQWLHSELNKENTTRTNDVRDWSTLMPQSGSLSHQSTARTGGDSAYVSSRAIVNSNLVDPVGASTPSESNQNAKSRLTSNLQERNNNTSDSRAKSNSNLGIDPKYYTSLHVEQKGTKSSEGRNKTESTNHKHQVTSTYFPNRQFPL